MDPKIDNDNDNDSIDVLNKTVQILSLNTINNVNLPTSTPGSGSTSTTNSAPPSSILSFPSDDPLVQSSSSSSDEFSLPPSFEVRPTRTRGLALFATRRIPAGSLIFSESPLISLAKSHERNYDAVEAAFCRLSKAEKTRYLELFDAKKSRMSKVVSVYYSNCYSKDAFDSPRPTSADHGKTVEQALDKDEGGGGGGSCIGVLSSRINHSCVPNACFSYLPPSPSSKYLSRPVTGTILFHAIKPIPANKEIYACYEKKIFLPRAQRQRRLLLDYGFRCECEACVPKRGSEFWERSDERRMKIGLFVTHLKGMGREWDLQRIDGRNDGDDAGGPAGLAAAEVGKKKAQKQREICETAIESLLKLEGLLIKEGLTYTPLVNTYRSLTKWNARLASLEPIANVIQSENSIKGDEVRKWKTKELQICEMCFGRESERCKILRKEVEELNAKKGEDRDMYA